MARRWNQSHQSSTPSWLLLLCTMGIAWSAGSHATAQSGLTGGMPFASVLYQEPGEAAPADASLPPADAANPDQVPAPPPATAVPGRTGISFLTLLTKGGWFMVPLAFLSLMVVAIGVERFLSLRREKIFPTELIDQISALSATAGGLDPRRAYQLCQSYPSSAAHIFRSMLTRVGRPQSEIEAGVREASQREANRLTHLGSWLSLAAAVAPLIGLLGTVWGITQAFYDTTQMVDGQNRSEALAQGIYTALVTTMVGLLIAIPAAIMAHHFENRIINLLNEIEEMIFNLMPQFERYEGQLRFTTDEVQPPPPERSGSGRLPTRKPGGPSGGPPGGPPGGQRSPSSGPFPSG